MAITLYKRDECITYFKKKYDYMDSDEIGMLFDIAQDIYLNNKYPFKDVYEVSEKDFKKHPTWFLRCIQEIIDLQGLNNIVGYSENGVSFKFDKAGISNSLLDEIMSEAGVV